MSDKKIVRTFNQSNIEQLVADGYVNLNQIANAAGKRIDNWLRLHSTKALIEEFENQITSLDPRKRPEPLIILKGGHRGGGTWAHPDIAVHFAQWCNRPSRKRDRKVVYLVKAGKYAKIGKTTLNSLDERISALQTGNPQKLKLLAVIEGYSEVEEALHAKYSEFKVRGEWFLFQRSMLSDFGIDDSAH